MNARRSLGSTYRLQLAGLGFEGARQLVGYLGDFGIDTLYVSPIFAAVPGSTHGYDVIDPTRLDPALGTPAEFDALLSELETQGMRLLIDIVPNHMAVHPDNRWWWNTLERGEDSVYASTFVPVVFPWTPATVLARWPTASPTSMYPACAMLE